MIEIELEKELEKGTEKKACCKDKHVSTEAKPAETK